MNLKKRKKKIVISLVAAVVFFAMGFVSLSFLVDKYMDVPSKVVAGTGQRIYLATSKFQPASIFTVIGCIFVTTSNMLLFSVTEILRRKKSDKFCVFEWSKLPLLAIFSINLNFFTSNYFYEMAALYLRKRGGDEWLVCYSKYNVVLSEVFFTLLIIILIYNTGKEKIKWFGTVVSLLAIVQSCFGVWMRSFTVPWLIDVYSVGIVVMMFIILMYSLKERGGLANHSTNESSQIRYAFFISDHGYGHMMRNISVIKDLLEEGNFVLIVCGDGQVKAGINFLIDESGLGDEEYVDRYEINVEIMETDFGLRVKDGSLELDVEAVRSGLEEYEAKFPDYVAKAVKLIEENRVTRVVSDICPWAITAAKECGIPSYLMASFTWIEIYEEYFPERLIAPFRECYANADKVLMYSLANNNTRARFADAVPVGYCARPIHEDHVAEIRENVRKQFEGENAPEDISSRKIVFMSIGLSNNGIDISCDVSDLPYYFIITKGVKITGCNVLDLDSKVKNMQDYVAAADYCIIKSGWTTISECMISGKPMALIGRPDVAEDRMSIKMLEDLGCGIEIDASELSDMESLMEKLEAYEWKCEPHENAHKKIAELLME